MTIILINQINKTFFFLRIFETLSYIVTMIKQVFYDLRIFLLFFGILMYFFSLVFAVTGVGNHRVPSAFADLYYQQVKDTGLDPPAGVPYEEYHKINPLLGYIFTTLRMSIGDYDFSAASYLDQSDNHLYWLVWLLVLVITNIVFLNFIIAEASASYENVKSNLDALIFKERTSLIGEAEDMLFTRLKNQRNFPKYIIIREITT
jgi:hypothetical protein